MTVNTITITQPSNYSLNVDGRTATGANIAAGGQSETITATFSRGYYRYGNNLSSNMGMVFYVRQLPQTIIDTDTIQVEWYGTTYKYNELVASNNAESFIDNTGATL